MASTDLKWSPLSQYLSYDFQALVSLQTYLSWKCPTRLLDLAAARPAGRMLSTHLQVQQRIDVSGFSQSARDQLPGHDEDLSLHVPAAKRGCWQCLGLRPPTASIGAFGGPDDRQRRDHDTPIEMVAAEIAMTWLPNPRIESR